jgi:CDP-diacylglycerol--glycerol-3-phosphate 3-phosphatidyltransferase
VRGLYALKPWYTRRLSGAVRAATTRELSPDLFTGLGVLSAAGAAGALAYGWWPLALLGLAGRLAGANLDGAVARSRSVSRPYGFVLNELGDRVGDLLAFVGLAVLASRTNVPVWYVLGAALAATLPTFVSLSAAGAGATRQNGGPLGKTERCALIVLAAAVTSLIAPICAVLTAGSLLTAAVRVTRARHELATA